MEPTRPELPSEAVELYNLFIHGEISRRAFMNGVQRFAIGGLTATAIVDALMPTTRWGSRFPDRRAHQGKLRDSAITKRQWNHQGLSGPPIQRRYTRRDPAKLPGVIIIHENRG